MDDHGIEARETVSASRQLGRADAAELARKASLVIVAKGKTVREFRPAGKAGSEVLAAMLGPTGNLRAPTIVRGKTVLVGFHPDVFEARLG